MKPLVSVLMPMRDAERYVRAALESVLAEAEIPLEVIVIDDGSRDDSAKIAASLRDGRINLIQGPVQGIAAAFNAGLEQVRGEFVMRCDADDRYASGRITHQVEWLRSHPEYGAVCGSFSTVDDRGRLLSSLETGDGDSEITDELREGKTRTHLCTFAIRARALRELGGCRPYFVTAEDLDLQLRLAEVARVWYQARPAYEYRLHGASVTHNQANAQVDFFESMARKFAAQRRETSMDDLQRGCPPAPPPSVGRSLSSAVHQQGMLLGQAWREHGQGQKWQAIRTGWRACWARPSDLQTWRSLVALLLR